MCFRGCEFLEAGIRAEHSQAAVILGIGLNIACVTQDSLLIFL